MNFYDIILGVRVRANRVGIDRLITVPTGSVDHSNTATVGNLPSAQLRVLVAAPGEVYLFLFININITFLVLRCRIIKQMTKLSSECEKKGPPIYWGLSVALTAHLGKTACYETERKSLG